MPACGADGSGSALEKEFERVWEEAVLPALKTLREHRAFLLRNPVPLVFRNVEEGSNFKDLEADAQLFAGALNLNRTLLLAHASRLERAGIPEERASEVLAWQMAGTLGHEVRHAITQARLSAIGSPCDFIEDEVMAYWEGMLIEAEARKLKPDLFAAPFRDEILDREHAAHLEAWRAGPDAFESRIRALLPKRDSLTGRTLPELARAKRVKLAFWSVMLQRARKREGALRESGEPGLEGEAAIAESRSSATIAIDVRELERCIAGLETPRLERRLRSVFLKYDKIRRSAAGTRP